jgi:hypothetical protein|tara:strand:- start:5297 stop:5704 length:408 start_codon:yes stop_codon:yes gene_type:complete
MSIGQFALQSAIYSTLNSDSNLTSTLGAGVFDDVTEGTDTPFVTIGEDTASEYDTKDLDGAETTINIDVWSEYKGSKECKQIMDRIHDLLHDSNISVTGFNLVNLRFEFSDIIRDPDGVTRHGVMRFRAVILGTS